MTEQMTDKNGNGSPAAIRDGLFSATELATPMAPLLQSATGHKGKGKGKIKISQKWSKIGQK